MNDRLVKILVALVVGTFFAVSVTIGSREGIWLDEAYTLHTTGFGVATAFREAISFELQPPLYFCLLAAWRSIDGSDFFARLFSALCATGTLAAVAVFTKRYLKAVNPAAATLVVAINPFLLWASQEIRVYALAIFVSALFILFFFRAYVRDEEISPGARAGAIALAIVALYTQYFLAFLAVGAGAATLFLRRSSAPRFFLDMSIVALAALPIFAVVNQQVAGTSAVSGSFKHDAYEFVSTLTDFVAPHRWAKDLPFHRPFWLAYAVLVSLPLLAGFYQARARTASLPGALWTIVAIVSVCFFSVMLLYPSLLQFPRHVVSLFIPVQLLLLSLLASIPRGARVRVIAAFLVCQAILDVPADATIYGHFQKAGHWPRVAAYLQKSVASHDALLVYHADFVLPLEHYYRGSVRALAIPRPLPYDRYQLRDYSSVGNADMARILVGLRSSSGSVWLVVPSPAVATNDLGLKVVTTALLARYKIVHVQSFEDVSVERLVPDK